MHREKRTTKIPCNASAHNTSFATARLVDVRETETLPATRGLPGSNKPGLRECLSGWEYRSAREANQ